MYASLRMISGGSRVARPRTCEPTSLRCRVPRHLLTLTEALIVATNVGTRLLVEGKRWWNWFRVESQLTRAREPILGLTVPTSSCFRVAPTTHLIPTKITFPLHPRLLLVHLPCMPVHLSPTPHPSLHLVVITTSSCDKKDCSEIFFNGWQCCDHFERILTHSGASKTKHQDGSLYHAQCGISVTKTIASNYTQGGRCPAKTLAG